MFYNLRKMSLALEDQLQLRKLSLPLQLHKQREANLSPSKGNRRKKVGATSF
jgi:hypothetical protein